MANGLLNCREMRPEPLRAEIEFGPALAPRLRVNKEPPLVPFELKVPRALARNIDPIPSASLRPWLTCHAALHHPHCPKFLPDLPSPNAPMNGRPRNLKSQSSLDLFWRKPCCEHGSPDLVPHPLGL